MYPDAYIQYLAHFHGDRDYFECHEILEEYWKGTNEGKHSVWVGFILLAVSNYHFRRGNKEGSGRTLRKAITIFENQIQNQSFGIDMEYLIKLSKERLISIQLDEVYSSFDLPITDMTLLAKCQTICHLKGFHWGQNSNLDDLNLIHRHLTRERRGIILERQNAIAKRNAK